MRVRWTNPALEDLRNIRAYLGKRDPTAAANTGQRIWKVAQELEFNPRLGRLARWMKYREFFVSGTTYILLYDISRQEVIIHAVVDGRMEWKEGEPPPRPATDW